MRVTEGQHEYGEFVTQGELQVSCVAAQLIRSTPQGLVVSAFTTVNSLRNQPGSPYPPPTSPKPPELETTAARRPPETPAMGAKTIGYCKPSPSVSTLLMATNPLFSLSVSVVGLSKHGTNLRLR